MRRRISWLVMGTTSVVVVSFVIPLCLLVRTLAEDRAMSAADQQARNVAILLAAVQSDRRLLDLLDSLDTGSTTTTSVLTVRGRQLGGGPAMADDPDVLRALGGEGFRVVRDDEGRVLLPVVIGERTAVVRTTVAGEQLHDGVLRAWLSIVGLGVVLLAAATIVARRLGSRISDPLLEVAGTAHRLREGDLDARAEPRGTVETQELARALNGLADRTTELLASERAAVGDLSHRLRTPVTALRLDAEQVADEALARRLGDHIGVLERTIDAIVAEARRPVRSDLRASGDLRRVVADRIAFWQALADDQGRAVTTTLPDRAVEVPLAEGDLRDLVDILVDNVFAHTADGTAFEVRLDAAEGQARLLVSDAGAGFSGDARADRPGTTGLGLDIATRMALGVGGELRRGRSSSGGAAVEVVVPLGG